MNNARKKYLSYPVLFQTIQDTVQAETSSEQDGKQDTEQDERFTKVKIWLMHLGENYNSSYFDKAVVDSALPTLSYIPIVGFIEDNGDGEKDFSDHRYIVVSGKEKYACIPYGVILSGADNNAHYEDRLCDDGKTRTFLVVDGFIWNMFEDGKEIIQRDIVKSHSMELWDSDTAYDGYEDENGCFHFTKFSFRAACILGNTYEPAMINSTVEVQFALSSFVKEFQNQFVKSVQKETRNQIVEFLKLNNKILEQGGDAEMSEKMSTESNILESNITEPNTKSDGKIEYTQTVKETLDLIRTKVSEPMYYDEDWRENTHRYYFLDVLEDTAIVEDVKNKQIVGLPYSVVGDDVIIDFENAIRMKITYTPFETSNGESVAEEFSENTSTEDNIDSVSSECASDSNTEYSVDANTAYIDMCNEIRTECSKLIGEIQNKYDTLQTDFNNMKSKYDEYVNAENERVQLEIEAHKAEEIAKYERVLKDCEEFNTLKETVKDKTFEEVENECAKLYAKMALAQISTETEFSKANGLTVGIADTDDDINDSVISTIYGDIPIRR